MHVRHIPTTWTLEFNWAQIIAPVNTETHAHDGHGNLMRKNKTKTKNKQNKKTLKTNKNNQTNKQKTNIPRKPQDSHRYKSKGYDHQITSKDLRTKEGVKW